MSDKPRVRFEDLAWAYTFARVKQGDRLLGPAGAYFVEWKHQDPDWLLLRYRADKEQLHRMIREGDSLLLELRPE